MRGTGVRAAGRAGGLWALGAAGWTVVVLVVVLQGCADALSNLMGHAGLFAGALGEGAVAAVNGKIFFELGLIAMSCAAMGASRWLQQHMGVYLAVSLLLMMVGMGLRLVFPSEGGWAAGGAVFLFGAGFIVAKFAGYCVLAFASDLRVVIVGMAASKVFKTLLASAVFLLPGEGQLAACGVIVALLGASMLWGARWMGVQGRAFRTAPVPPVSAVQRGSLLGQAALVSIVLAVVQAYTPFGSYGSAPVRGLGELVAYGAAAALLLPVSWYVYLRERPTTMEERSRLAFAVVLLGLVVLAGQSAFTWTLAPGAQSLASFFLELFAQVGFGVAAVSLSWSLRGRGPLFWTAAMMVVFALTSLVWIFVVQNTRGVASVLTLVVAYGATMVLPRVLPRPAGAPPADKTLVDDAYLHSVAAAHDLSPRETEVFMLLAQGRSRAFIQDALSVSEGTVKTHTSRIYQKLGVASKQELLSYVFDGQG